MRILVVFGTRPEAIKMAPVINALKAHGGFDPQVCITGQHQTMVQQVLDVFDIAPDHALQVMRPGQSLSDMFGRIVADVAGVVQASKPQVVLVHGDTATTLAASLAAYFNRIPVGHVEAGLRTHDLYAPWPEEANRKLTAGVAAWHFAPTQRARQNLLSENVDASRIHVVGNTVIDALLQIHGRVTDDAALKQQCAKPFDFLDAQKKLILVTGHRRESFGRGFENICTALLELASRQDVELLYPVHLNPNVQGPVYDCLGDRKNIHLLPPVDYVTMVYLIGRCHLVLTDSGGIQEEAPALGKPVLVMRETTERPEAVDAGVAKLVGTDPENICRHVIELLDQPQAYRAMSSTLNPFGDGTAGRKIVAILHEAESTRR